MKNAIAILIAALLFTGCGTTTTRATKNAHANATPCCASIGALPAAQPLVPGTFLPIQAGTPHFDLGIGLAPFHIFKLDNQRQLHLMSAAQGSGRIFGGDGKSHFADLRAFVISSDNKVSQLSAGQPYMKTYGVTGRYMLTWDLNIPEGAVTLIVTTSPASIGKQASVPARMPTGGYRAGGVYVPVRFYKEQMPIVMSVYGEFVILPQNYGTPASP